MAFKDEARNAAEKGADAAKQGAETAKKAAQEVTNETASVADEVIIYTLTFLPACSRNQRTYNLGYFLH